MERSLRGHLLIAAPSLFDYFRRTVVLVLEHTEEGALGVVLNRPSETSVADAVPPLAELAEPDQPVRIGGPVGDGAVVALGDFEDLEEAASPVVGTVGVVDPENAAPTLRRLRVFAGYAGWSGGQLDAEVEEGAWIVEPADPDDPFCEEDIWSVALARKGREYSVLATMPADPSLN
jgi:putative transcriptional regulator